MTLSLYLPDAESPSAARMVAAAAKAVQLDPQRIMQRRTETGPYPGRNSLAVAVSTSIVEDEPPRIHYLALPEGTEEAPFLELVRELIGGNPLSAGGRPAGMDMSEQPAELMVLIAPGCPSCPLLVRAALTIAAAARAVTVTIVDVTAHQDLAERFGVRSVPVLVIDGGRSVVGVITVAELAELLAGRRSAAYQRQLFASLLESGRWADAAHSLSHGDAAEHFLALWRDSTLETRIRLLLAAEETLAKDPAALDPVVEQLIPVLDSDDPARRGDTADLLGRIGHPAARPAIEAMLDDPNPEIVEAATDALASFPA